MRIVVKEMRFEKERMVKRERRIERKKEMNVVSGGHVNERTEILDDDR